jgi:hypothetical protein
MCSMRGKSAPRPTSARPARPLALRLDAKYARRYWLGPTWPTCPPLFWQDLIVSVDAIASDDAAVVRLANRQRSIISTDLDLGWIGWTGWIDTAKSRTSYAQPGCLSLDGLDSIVAS